jgi:hypothetical protein
MGVADSPAYAQVTEGTYKWLLGWGLIIVLLIAGNKSRAGHVILYYSLVLMVLFMVVTQGPFITGHLTVIGTKPPVPPIKTDSA